MNSDQPRNLEDAATFAAGRESTHPLAFSEISPGAAAYMHDPSTRLLLEFFQSKGLARLKEEDRQELWYEDWIVYQHKHRLYADMLTPASYSTRGGSFDLLRYARFLEVFAYCSAAHGYSLQVTFLGLFSILMGTNESLKRDAIAAMEAGQLLAFGVSEKAHGSDLMANEFSVSGSAGTYTANGTKHYIGNSDVAFIISTLGRHIDPADQAASHSRLPFMLVALRPRQSPCFHSLGKISTLGVRAANVGAFEVKDYPLAESDIIAQGRAAWDAVFGTVTLGKFFLGFGSIGMCEHAWQEALAHLRARVLYGKPAIDMAHIQAAMCQAGARLMAMKLFAFRALDYLHAASAGDRRYLLFCAVQKAKVSTEGVKVMSLLAECIGAKGFESDTYFEMARRDVPLIPSLEGSMHINLSLVSQFIPRYFDRFDPALPMIPSLLAGKTASRENPYLAEARTGALHAVAFRPFLEAYQPLMAIPNIATFAQQLAAFHEAITRSALRQIGTSDMHATMLVGQSLATIAYGQLIAEAAAKLEISPPMISAIFHLLIEDLTQWALQLAALPRFDEPDRNALFQMVRVPQTSAVEWKAVEESLLRSQAPAK